MTRCGALLLALLATGCTTAPAALGVPETALPTRTTGGPPIPANGPCPAPSWDWRIRVHVGPGIDDRPLFTVTGKVRLKDRQWAELREEYLLSEPAAPLYLVRMNVRMSPTEEPAGQRVIELTNTQPVSSRPAVVLVHCGSQLVARFEDVRWRGR